MIDERYISVSMGTGAFDADLDLQHVVVLRHDANCIYLEQKLHFLNGIFKQLIKGLLQNTQRCIKSAYLV